jgi:DNA-binding NarL/FixJ family response regulator
MMQIQTPITVLLVDDHQIVRTGIRVIIQQGSGIEVVAEASSCAEALDAARRVMPDIVLLDLELGSENGLDVITDLREISDQIRVIVLTAARDELLHQQAVSRGALGVVNKENAQDVITSAIRSVAAGEAWLEPKLTANLLAQFTGSQKKKENPEAAKIASLSKRELEVVSLIGEGLKSREIAERLFISEITVRHHLTSIFSKLDVSDRVELILYSYRHGLAKAPV